MNKILTTSFVVLSLFFTSTQVKAEDTPQSIKPFAGLEFGYGTLGMTDGVSMIAQDGFSSVSVLAGFKTKETINNSNLLFGLTAFYQNSAEEEKTVASLRTRTSFDAFGADALFFLPINEKFEVTFTLGFGFYDFEIETNNALFGTHSENHFGLRLGIGGEYKINQQVSLTAMLRYIDFPDYDSYSDVMENMSEFGIGLKFYF